MRLQAILRIVLVLALVILLGTLSQLYKTEFDWTYGGRNTLSDASLELLERMPEPIVFTAYTSADAEMKRTVLGDLARYRRVRDNIEVEFVDPSRNPERAREAGIRNFNEVEIRYDGNSEVVSSLTEPAITGALQKLANPSERVVYFLRGHGERSLGGGGGQGGDLSMSGLVTALANSGLRVEPLNLAEAGRIPDDATTLVLASPNSTPLPQEQQRIASWIDDGGNFVWLADPDSARELEPVTEALGVTWQPGVAVFPDYEKTSGHPGIFVATSYPPNPLTRRLDAITVFPLISGVEWDMDGEWNGMPLIVTRDNAWLETGAIEGDLVFDDAAGDIRGPITVAATLTREREQEDGSRLQQRVALVGDSDFLINAYLEQAANRQLALNLFQWAAARDKQLDIDVPKAPDSSLRMSGFALTAIAGGIVIGLPLLLVAFGVTRWALRRRR
jgi:ABC-type uncharacterized transport system involved in gliding motility auxiliary subunit